MNRLPGEQHLAFKSFLQWRLIGHVREEWFSGQRVHLGADGLPPHRPRPYRLSQSIGQSRNGQSEFVQAASECDRGFSIPFARVIGLRVRKTIQDRFIEKVESRMLQEAACACILGQQIFDGLPQRRVLSALLIKKGFALGWLERQRGLEQRRHGLWLTSHSSRPGTHRLRKNYAKASAALTMTNLTKQYVAACPGWAERKPLLFQEIHF